MALFGRSAPWRDLVELSKHEKALVAAETPAGWVVATTVALWLPGRTGMTRVAWELVDNASWDRDTGVLSVRESAPLGGQARRWTVRLDDERDLLLVIKERVRATVVATRHVPLLADRGVTVVARRPPGTDELTWTVSVDRGVDVDDDTRIRIEAAVASLRAELGR